MILSNTQMNEDRVNGKIIIEPFDFLSLNTSSYDVRLGQWFFREIKPFNPEGNFQFFNPYSESEVAKVWGSQPEEAGIAADWKRWYPYADWTNIYDEDRVIVIPPGDTMLAHTKEFIGGVNYRTSMMKARSSFGRCHIEVCKCAGYGDVGYFNRWTMEITNNSRYYHIPLVVDRRIAQIVFMETGPIFGATYSEGGKYQMSSTLADIIHAWSPMMMLPRLHLDRDIRK